MACSSSKGWWLLPSIWVAAAAGAAPPAALSQAAPSAGPPLAGPPSPPAATAARPVPPTPPRQLPVSVAAASSHVDYKPHRYSFEKVVISQGTMRVQADRAQATGLDFANSHWTFERHVH